MRILVSFKVTPDYESLRDADWVEGPAGGVETRFARRVINCFDESALETALRLTESATQRSTATSLGALCIGGREAEPYLQTLLALGFEGAARVSADAADVDFAPAVTAAVIAGYARAERADLLLLGCRSGPGDGGTIPFRIAEELGWPCLTQVIAVEARPDDRLRVTCEADDGLLSVTARPPCILALGNAVISHLRAPTLTARLAVRDRRVAVLAPLDLGVEVPAPPADGRSVLTGLERVDRARSGVVVDGADPREKARRLFDRWLRDRLAAS